MPDWSQNAREIHQLIEERGDFLRAAAMMEDEDLTFINKHLDLAFEGRHDHLRTGAPTWVTPPPPPKAHGIKRRIRITEKSLVASVQGNNPIPTVVETYVEPWCEACEKNYCTTTTTDRWPLSIV